MIENVGPQFCQNTHGLFAYAIQKKFVAKQKQGILLILG